MLILIGLISLVFIGLYLLFSAKGYRSWEAFGVFTLLTLTVTVIILCISNAISNTKSSDIEYLNSRVQSVTYYEPWDEWIDQMCSRQVACGTDSDGNTEYCTEWYDCSYRKYHDSAWVMRSVDKNTFNIGGATFRSFVW